MMFDDYSDWKTVSTADVVDDYPEGSIAVLVAPYPVDTGIYSAGRTVDRFVKRSAGGGRWVSYPGSDVYYSTLSGLMLDAEVLEIIVPEIGDEPELVDENLIVPGEPQVAPPPPPVGDSLPLAQAGAAVPKWAWLAGLAALFWFTRR